MSDQQITGLSVSTALTVPANAQSAFVQAETQNLRFKTDGTAVTSTTGIVLRTTDAPLLIKGRDALESFRVIEVLASGKLNVSYNTQ